MVHPMLRASAKGVIGMNKLSLAIAILVMCLAGCAASGTSPQTNSTQGVASESGGIAGSQAATGVCRAFLINGPVDLGRQVIVLQSAGENTEELTREMMLAFEDVAAGLPSEGEDVAAFRELMDTVNAGDPWEGALTQFVEAFAEACGVQIVRH